MSSRYDLNISALKKMSDLWVEMFKCPIISLLIVYDAYSSLCPQEPDKPVRSLDENEEVNMKEYNDYLTVEESILKGNGLWPATADTQDT